jgi:hypothetical protein
MQNRYLAGWITVIQEARFRLVTDDGRSFLLTLDRKSPVQLPAIRLLQKSHTPVRVEYSGEPNTAHLVQPLDQWPRELSCVNEQSKPGRQVSHGFP